MSLLLGSIGVVLLLAAFALNLHNGFSAQSTPYVVMNAAGASLSAWYAWDGGLIPLVILELV